MKLHLVFPLALLALTHCAAPSAATSISDWDAGMAIDSDDSDKTVCNATASVKVTYRLWFVATTRYVLGTGTASDWSTALARAKTAANERADAFIRQHGGTKSEATMFGTRDCR